ncbi:MAG: hypothetical protein KKD76_03370, partial [Verrucomicrobia bacterium]|nr:hypothetical protein [Verrucomicrobiota bacterium]
MNITKGQHPVVRFDVNPKSHQTVLFAEAELKKYLTKITGVSFQRTLSADRPGLATITLKLDHKPA